MVVANKADSAFLYNLTIFGLKNVTLKNFSNVEYCIIENQLVVGITEPIAYDPARQLSFETNKIEVYELVGAKIEFSHSINRSNEEEFNKYYDQLIGYSSTPPSSDKLIDYGQLVSTDFKTDSAEKYALIIETNAGILFANPKGKVFISNEGEKIEIKNDDFERGSYFDGQNGTFAIETLGDLELIINCTFGNYYEVYDDNGDLVIDEMGNTIYMDVEDVQQSGVYSWKHNKWVVPPVFMDVKVMNDKIVAQKNIYTRNPDNKYELLKTPAFCIYSIEGKLLDSLTNPQAEELLKRIFDAEVVIKADGSYSIYEVKKGHRYALVDYFESIRYAYLVASFDQGYVPHSFNSQSRSYVTFKKINSI